jgi:hypothetical protein
MSISDFFKKLGAELRNNRWSWGGVRKDGSIVLRVWQDETIKRDGYLLARLTYNDKFKDNPDNLGFRERNEHVGLIESGKTAILVMCKAEDPEQEPRNIAAFNRREVFTGSSIEKLDDDYWIRIDERIPVKSLI